LREISGDHTATAAQPTAPPREPKEPVDEPIH
jgi:hypothetical protein